MSSTDQSQSRSRLDPAGSQAQNPNALVGEAVWDRVPTQFAPTETESEVYTPPSLESFFPPPEPSFTQRMIAKCKREPLVPIGFLATTGCLGMGLVAMTKGDTAKQQRMMRGRVGFQAFTLAAVVVGLLTVAGGKKN